MPLLDILHPERLKPAPDPLPVSLRPVVLVGMTLWLLGLVGTGIGWATGGVPASWFWTCVTGLALGAAGLALLRRKGWS